MRKAVLIGNPNSGKSTLFNILTGANQRVGNWPGVTVEKKFGFLALDGEQVELVDLPGIYSLEQDRQAIDERIAADCLKADEIDLIVNIIDAGNLERGLVLTQQLLEKRIPVVVVLNMLDVAARQGVTVSRSGLERRLGVPVVETVAARRRGVGALRARLGEALARPGPERGAAGDAPDDAPDERILRRYFRARRLAGGVVAAEPQGHSPSERIDGVVLNRWLGTPIFLLVIYLMFTFAVNLGAVFIDFFDILFAAVLVDGAGWALERASAPPVLVTLLADGLGGGVTLVATFIPVIGFLYLCLSFLEDSGYMARAAFVVDRLMAGIGLPGNAFVPLIVGFGCNVPAVMATRTLGRDSDRLMTIAMAPFMSCGARLTVYALFAAAFFGQNGQNIVFGLYLLGVALAVFTGWVFRRQLFTGEITPSFQEMPAWHVPIARNILLTTWFRLKSFIFRAGKTIVLVVMVLSFLNSIGTDLSFGNEDSEDSVLSAIGKSITPAFAPIGIQPENWPATVGLFTGMFAKEAIVGTLDALYSGPEAAGGGAPDLAAAAVRAGRSVRDELAALGGRLGDPLGIAIGDADEAEAAALQEVRGGTLTNMAALFASPFAAFCYLVFVLLYAPCVAVLGAVGKEAGWRWAVLVFSWCTALAYIAATVTYQLGGILVTPLTSAAWTAGMLAVLLLFIGALKRLASRLTPRGLIPAAQV